MNLSKQNFVQKDKNVMSVLILTFEDIVEDWTKIRKQPGHRLQTANGGSFWTEKEWQISSRMRTESAQTSSELLRSRTTSKKIYGTQFT